MAYLLDKDLKRLLWFVPILFLMFHAAKTASCTEVIKEAGAGEKSIDSGERALNPIHAGGSEEEKKPVMKTISGIVLEPCRKSVSAVIHPQNIEISVLCSPEEHKNAHLTREKIKACVRIGNRKPGICAKPAVIILPEGCVLVDAYPEVFVVEVKP